MRSVAPVGFRTSFALVPAMLLLLVVPAAPSQSASTSQFPIGSVNSVAELPAGPFRAQLQSLPPQAQGKALQWLNSFHFTTQDLASLRADSSGGILYVCPASVEPPADPVPGPVISEAAVPISPFPPHLVFHSRPGAPNVLYINFCGENVINTEWNTVVSRTEIPAVAFSTDSDLTTFSDAEQAAIKSIWQRMAEDYAPFNIDVTTERPATFTTRTAMALITRNTDANGQPNPYNTAGGVAYVNVFGTTSYAKYRPAWIYHNNLWNVESYVAEAASHEVGHNMGLSHDGRTDGQEYYGGHGSGDISWGPLMGTGYGQNVSHWCKGDYYLASNTQDDLATIAGKLTYRSDDHGNTAGTATGLITTGNTNIVSTTPENDPANANPSNKGVLERNTDLDVFYFVTGAGPVNISVKPWIMPSGTRGGNIDILLQLYDEAGTLLLTNNPVTTTTALIQTNLPEGRYYLHVRTTGTGDPFNATPSGYTSYGSIGQYFFSGWVTEPTTFIAPPVAELSITDIISSGQGAKQLQVTYSDDVAVNVSTIGTNDVRILGPNGYDRMGQFISVDVNNNGTPRMATYSAPPPSGSTWLSVDNGNYTVWMETNQVSDTEGAWVAAGRLGGFKVAVPVAMYSANMDSDPGWTLEPQWQYGTPTYPTGGPTAGSTGSKIVAYNLSGNYGDRLSTKYATTPPINTSGASSATLRFKRWLKLKAADTASIQVSANGTTWTDLWSTSSTVADSSWQEVQYTLPPGIVGSSSVRIRWGLASNPAQNDIGWNIDDVELLGDGVLDTTPPVPVLSVANITMGGAPSHACNVTYTDDTAVRLSSLGSTDLLVRGPNGYSNLVEFVGADLPTDGTPLTGSYSIPASGDVWDEADNGTYSVALIDNEVADVNNNATPGTTLGSFTVSISSTTPGYLIVTPAGGLSSSGTVGGPFSPSSIVYTLTNSGGSSLNWTVSKSQFWVSLSATAGNLAAGETTNITVSINSNANTLSAASYSDTVQFANTTSGSGNTSRSVSLTVNSLGMLAVSPVEDLSSSGTVGGPFSPSSTVYTLTNTGGSSLNWAVSKSQSWVSLSATAGNLAAGKTTNITVSINSNANTLSAASYSDTVQFANTTSGNGNTSRSVSLTALSPEPVPTIITNVALLGADITFSFLTITNQTYTVEYTGSFPFSNWTALATIPGSGTLITFTNLNALPGQGFYRVRSP